MELFPVANYVTFSTVILLLGDAILTSDHAEESIAVKKDVHTLSLPKSRLTEPREKLPVGTISNNVFLDVKEEKLQQYSIPRRNHLKNTPYRKEWQGSKSLAQSQLTSNVETRSRIPRRTQEYEYHTYEDGNEIGSGGYGDERDLEDGDVDDEIDDTTGCDIGKVRCDDGTCLQGYKVCNGLVECPNDDADERNCPGSFPVSLPQPVSGCRADTQINCPDMKTRICEVQLCDGMENCPKMYPEEAISWDESGCETDNDTNDFTPTSSRPLTTTLTTTESFTSLNFNLSVDPVFANVSIGDAITFHCFVNPPTIHAMIWWTKTGSWESKRASQDSGSGSSALTIHHVNKADLGKYVCHASTERHNVIAEVVLGVRNCQLNEFKCDSLVCIPLAQKCNSVADCGVFGEDEQDCPPLRQKCQPDEIKCDGHCGKKCDNKIDCAGGLDEQDCHSFPSKCRPSPLEHMCHSDESCIDGNRICDGILDCQDGSDERDCFVCGVHEYRCKGGQCIATEKRCDGYQDCPDDNSDESDCIPFEEGCRENQFRCNDGFQCIPDWHRCNGQMDCRDRSDETNCGHPGGNNVDLRIYPKEQIIDEGRIAVFQCRDEGPLRVTVVWSGTGSGLPLPAGATDKKGRLEIPNVKLSHTGTYICRAIDHNNISTSASASAYLKVLSRETTIPVLPIAPCGSTEATCSNGDCIAKSEVCDGKKDCTDGSDERNCYSACEPNEFECDNGRCVLKTWRCDMDDDCGDASDERFCATNPPGSPCQYREFMCLSEHQCVPKSFHCDGQVDCQDQSDEIGCTAPIIIVSPPPVINVSLTLTFEINCTAVGIPTPEINWRLNWGHVPEKCISINEDREGNRGFGQLTCKDASITDQGAYSCEAINSKGSCFAGSPGCGQQGQDAYVNVIHSIHDAGEGGNPHRTCPPMTFAPPDCLRCFCFGIVKQCSSAKLFTYQIIPPRSSALSLFEMNFKSNQSVDLTNKSDELQSYIKASPFLGGITSQRLFVDTNVPILDNRTIISRRGGQSVLYFDMHESVKGKQLNSYGGYLIYKIRNNGKGRPNLAPQVIITGNGLYLASTKMPNLESMVENKVVHHMWFGHWFKKAPVYDLDQDKFVQHESMASREEIMTVLENIEHLLIKAEYTDQLVDTVISDIRLDSAKSNGINPALFIEQCLCPRGYSGLSCEECAVGFERSDSGIWKGTCQEQFSYEQCPKGTYEDLGKGTDCQPCPCPHTSGSNHFGRRECYLDTDSQVTCKCPPGYLGRRCEKCKDGYVGNPLLPGDFCRQGFPCDPRGSISYYPDPLTGRCNCRDSYYGANCSSYGQRQTCQNGQFYSGQSGGCLDCFCMGVKSQDNQTQVLCQASNLHRSVVEAASVAEPNDEALGFTLMDTNFNIIKDFGADFRKGGEPVLLVKDEAPELFDGEVAEYYYWNLPSKFLGNKLGSYGGWLNFSLIHSPKVAETPKEVPFVQLKGNGRVIQYFLSPLEWMGNDGGERTFSLPIIGSLWKTKRENMMVALSDLDHILILATLRPRDAKKWGIKDVSMSIGVERSSTDEISTKTGEVANMVERCFCPPGYMGLSCEDCAIGFKKRFRGDIYSYYNLSICVPCECGGRASECHPETGVCQGCQENTSGDKCEVCAHGYVGDPASLQGCHRVSTCSCNLTGSTSSDCNVSTGHCNCKTNVQGKHCDRCMPKTFGLSKSNPQGCTRCWCSGVSDSCSDAVMYWSSLSLVFVNSYHNVYLTLGPGEDLVEPELNFLNNNSFEVSHSFEDTFLGLPYFWMLPEQFLGNKVHSWMGNLTLTQTVIGDGPVRKSNSPFIIILGSSGISLHYTLNYSQIEWIRGQSMVVRVPLMPGNWGSLRRGIPHKASREDILSVLSNIVAILVQATPLRNTRKTSLRSVVLDIAVPDDTGHRVEQGIVEECRCPSGYRGLSCEECAEGYYRDVRFKNIHSVDLCMPCRCGGNEYTCYQHIRTKSLVCVCKPGFKGPTCNEPEEEEEQQQVVSSLDDNLDGILQGLEMIVQPQQVDVFYYNDVQIACYVSAGGQNATGEYRLFWRKKNGFMSDSAEQEGGVLSLSNVTMQDSGVYECVFADSEGREVLLLESRVNVNLPQSIPKAQMSVERLNLVQGTDAILVCNVTGHPPPVISWTKVGEELNSPTVNVNQGVLTIRRAAVEDRGVYVCTVKNNLGSSRAYAVVEVERREPPELEMYPTEQQVVHIGNSVLFQCRVLAGIPTPNITWKRLDGMMGSGVKIMRTGVLRIISVKHSDEGRYMCTVSNIAGRKTIVASLIVQERPSIMLVPSGSVTLHVGQSMKLLCKATGDPAPTVTWHKLDGHIPQQSSLKFQTIFMAPYVSKAMEGSYLCRATNEAGEAEEVVQLNVVESYNQIWPISIPNEKSHGEIERKSTNEVDPENHIQPSDSITVFEVILGSNAELSCQLLSADDLKAKWTKFDGGPLPRNAHQSDTSSLYFKGVKKENSGLYKCEAVDPTGSIIFTKIMKLVVFVPPHLRLEPMRQVVQPGDNTMVKCIVLEGDQPISLEWMKVGEQNLPSHVLSSSDGRLHFRNISVADEGSYQCRATNLYGTVDLIAEIIVEDDL